MSVTKLLKLQDEIMSSTYDKKFYSDYIEHREQTVCTHNFHLQQNVLKICPFVYLHVYQIADLAEM